MDMEKEYKEALDKDIQESHKRRQIYKILQEEGGIYFIRFLEAKLAQDYATLENESDTTILFRTQGKRTRGKEILDYLDMIEEEFSGK